MALADELAACALRLPEPGRDAAEADGVAAASRLWAAAAADARVTITAQLEGYLRDGDALQARLAAALAGDARLAPDVLMAALARTDLPEDARGALRMRVGTAMARGTLAYDTAMREHLGKRDSQLVGAAVAIHDHAWFVDHLKDVLGADASSASNAIWYVASELNEAEARDVRDEIAGRREALGDDWVTMVLSVLDYELYDGRFDNRRGKPRWLRSDS